GPHGRLNELDVARARIAALDQNQFLRRHLQSGGGIIDRGDMRAKTGGCDRDFATATGKLEEIVSGVQVEQLEVSPCAGKEGGRRSVECRPGIRAFTLPE